jgi:ComF family protein
MRGFDCAYSYGFYEGPLQELIHLLKYQGIETLAGPLGRYLMAALPRDERVDLIVPVPMHWWRKWRRGFNQSELLAQAVAREAGIPFADAMRRTRNTPPQAGLSDHERRHNLTGAFSVPAKRRVEGRRVLLIDDVMTTGATTSACGAALLRAGAERVLVLTVARADRRIASPAPRARAKSNDAGGW